MTELTGILEVENPTEALRNRNGVFRVISPDGNTFLVTCRKGSNMRIREIGASENATVTEQRRWRIEKLSLPVA